MARGDSTIRVSIIGDAKQLGQTLDGVDRKLGGFGGTAKGIAVGAIGLIGVSEGFQAIGDALEKADQHGDALQSLGRTLTPQLAATLDSMATDLTKIGLSQTEFDVLATDFANFGTAAGIAKDQIAGLAPGVVSAAQAFSLADAKGRPAAEVLELIEKASGGSAKAAAELGVTIDPTASKLDNMRSIVAQLNPLVNDLTTGTGDLEQKQDELGAKVDNLTTKLGEGLAPVLSTVVGFINDEIDAIPGAVAGWQMLGAAIEQFGRDALGPIARVNDALGALGNLISEVGFNLTHIGQNTPSEKTVLDQVRANALRNGRP